LPVYLTEFCIAGVPWENENTGCVQAAYQDIDRWNALYPDRPISCLALYRWAHDQWAIYNKPAVQADFFAATTHGYAWPREPEPEPPEEDNLLLNPSFEQGWYSQDAMGILVLPDHWAAEYLEGGDPWFRPEIKPNEEFVTDGQYSIRAFPPAHSRGRFGIWQERTVEPGQWYKFSADVRIESNPPGDNVAFVGIQPWGASIFERQMIWGKETGDLRTWRRVEVIAQAFGGTIRVAMGATNKWPTANNTVWWDNARLEEWECEGDPQPPDPGPGPTECQFSEAAVESVVRRVVVEELERRVWAPRIG